MDFFEILYNIPIPNEWGLLSEVWHTFFSMFLGNSLVTALAGFYTILIYFFTVMTLWYCMIKPLMQCLRMIAKRTDKK